jgi:signal transduction histidine kinase
MAIAPDPPWSEQRHAGTDDVGRQLHDIVVPQLFVLTTGLAALQRHRDRVDGDRLVDDLAETAAQALADLRAISRGRSLALGGPLAHVAQRLAEATRSVAQLSGCDVTVDAVDDDDTSIDSSLDHEVRAVVWEGIANAIRHGGARNVHVEIISEGGRLRIVVIDDGTWRAVDPRGTGLAGLERRATTRAGSLTLRHTETGTRLEWEVPLVMSTGDTTRR